MWNKKRRTTDRSCFQQLLSFSLVRSFELWRKGSAYTTSPFRRCVYCSLLIQRALSTIPYSIRFPLSIAVLVGNASAPTLFSSFFFIIHDSLNYLVTILFTQRIYFILKSFSRLFNPPPFENCSNNWLAVCLITQHIFHAGYGLQPSETETEG